MSHTITVRITDSQSEKIKNSGLSYSEYTRQAIDFYELRKYEALLYYKVNVVDECINLLSKYMNDMKEDSIIQTYKKIYKNHGNVKINRDKSNYNNRKNVKKIYKNDEKNLHDVKKIGEDILYNSDENVNMLCDDPMYLRYKNYLPLISKMLHIHGTVPKYTKIKIIDETATTSKILNNFIFNHRDEIKNIEYE